MQGVGQERVLSRSGRVTSQPSRFSAGNPDVSGTACQRFAHHFEITVNASILVPPNQTEIDRQIARSVSRPAVDEP